MRFPRSYSLALGASEPVTQSYQPETVIKLMNSRFPDSHAGFSSSLAILSIITTHDEIALPRFTSNFLIALPNATWGLGASSRVICSRECLGSSGMMMCTRNRLFTLPCLSSSA